ncbi:MAG TPA: hypothetical protein VNH17_04025, partial [Streptosporangiaceae bacterium]|nr:hypothetical protein [Streptosporangiaceae bacterium]
MTFVEDAVKLVRDYDRSRPRSRQVQIGWSEVGGCRAYIGFRLDEAYPEDTDTWAAQRGTALDEYVGPILAAGMGARYQVPLTYRGIPGHADLVGPDWVADMKAPELGNAKAWMADPAALWQKRVQAHGYAAGLIDAGELPQDCTVRLLIMPSGGTYGDWWAWEEPFDRELADAGADRLAEVRIRHQAGEPLQKDMPYQWCADWCGFFALCRKPEEAEELAEITDPEIAVAAARYGELLEITGPAEREKKALAPLLRGLHAQARGWRVTTSAPGRDGVELDEEAVRADYAARGVPVPEIVKPGQSPRLSVTRI